MRIRVKKHENRARIASTGEIKEVIINQNIQDPALRSISICFRGSAASGIIDFTPAEFAALQRTLQKNTGLVKEIKIV